ncbi:MAG: hypothetical protein PUP92_14185 [Rhizonema sp. PD38]|nr:hypothetical protein [Rhizonema sp. PD38]
MVPGESVTLLLEGYFHWESHKLKFIFREKSGSSWIFSDFNPGTYLVQVIYENLALQNMGMTIEPPRRQGLQELSFLITPNTSVRLPISLIFFLGFLGVLAVFLTVFF